MSMYRKRSAPVPFAGIDSPLVNKLHAELVAVYKVATMYAEVCGETTDDIDLLVKRELEIKKDKQ